MPDDAPVPYVLLTDENRELAERVFAAGPPKGGDGGAYRCTVLLLQMMDRHGPPHHDRHCNGDPCECGAVMLPLHPPDIPRAAEYAAMKADQRKYNHRRRDDLNLRASFLLLLEPNGWCGLFEDTPEAAAAWVAGRKFRAEHGPDPDLSAYNEEAVTSPGEAPYVKRMDLYRESQNLRIEWQIGWEYEHMRETKFPDEVREDRETRKRQLERKGLKPEPLVVPDLAAMTDGERMAWLHTAFMDRYCIHCGGPQPSPTSSCSCWNDE